MIKVVTPDSFGFDQPVAARVKVASCGLVGRDRDLFVKRAGVDFLDCLGELRPGEVPVHVLAIGATEFYGANRNGDGFSTYDCRQSHGTFKKHGHYFRNHQNKSNNIRYGRIVKTAFHEPMKRIELLIGLFATKEAADRAGELGRVADTELEKLAMDKCLPGSMACKVAHDVCMHCANKAREKDEYCDVVPVKYAGRVVPPCSGFGCAHGLTKVGRDGRMQFVDNPHPVFFDYSGVYRNADRISFGLGILKVAAADEVVGGAELARRLSITAPAAVLLDDPGLSTRAMARLKVAVDLAAHERDHGRYSVYDGGLAIAKVASFPDAPAAQVLRALADARVVLGVEDWLRLCVGKEAADAALEVEARLPGVFGRAVAAGVDLGSDAYAPAAALPSAAVRDWAEKVAATCALGAVAIAHRAERAALRGERSPSLRERNTKSASSPDDAGGAEALAREYAKYQVATLAAFPGSSSEDPLTNARALLARRNALLWS